MLIAIDDISLPPNSATRFLQTLRLQRRQTSPDVWTFPATSLAAANFLEYLDLRSGLGSTTTFLRRSRCSCLCQPYVICRNTSSVPALVCLVCWYVHAREDARREVLVARPTQKSLTIQHWAFYGNFQDKLHDDGLNSDGFLGKSSLTPLRFHED